MKLRSLFCLIALSLSCLFAQEQILVPCDSLASVKAHGARKDLQCKLSLQEEQGRKYLNLHAKTLDNIEGSQYYFLDLLLPRPMDLHESGVVFDIRSAEPETTVALYIRFYNTGSSKPCWSFYSWDKSMRKEWKLFQVQHSLGEGGLSWEQEVCEERDAEQVNRIEIIIGTRVKNAEVDLALRSVSLTQAKKTLMGLKQYPPRTPNTPIVQNGKAAPILHPDTPAGKTAADTLAKAIQQKSGILPACRPATKADFIPEDTVILLGSLQDNPAFQLLYARGLTLCDAIFPGPDGYFLHTIHNPFGKGSNILVVGASDDAGLSNAVQAFTAKVLPFKKSSELMLPHIHLIQLGGDAERFANLLAKPQANYLEEGMKKAQGILDKGTHCSIAGQLATLGRRYLLNNAPEEAQLYVQLWKKYLASAKADARKFGGPWGFDSDFPSLNVISSWDLLEEEPSLTDEDRISVLKAMTKWVYDTVLPSCSGGTAGRVTHNHGTFPSLGCTRFGMFLQEHFPEYIDGVNILKRADEVFCEQAKHPKPMEDCNGYQWLTLGHTLQYSMLRPDDSIFRSKVAEKISDFCIDNMDNMSIQVPYGDTGNWKCWDSEIICLDIVAFATGNAKARWAANYKRSGKNRKPSLGEYTQLPKPGDQAPNLSKLSSWPILPAFFNTFPSEQKALKWQDCIDKIIFRENVAPKALYLLYDGVSTGTHKHQDGNSIPRFAQFNRIWLADNDYFKASLKYHNSIAILANGESQTIPQYAQLLETINQNNYAASVTRMNNYAHTDWTRAIIWLQDSQDIIVLDRMKALQEADFQFRLFWHGIGEATASQDGLLLRQQGPSMRIQLAPGSKATLLDDKELGTNWAGYEYAEHVVRSMNALANVHLKEGESYLFATAFHGRASGDEPLWKMAVLEDQRGVLINDGTRSYTVALSADSRQVAFALDNNNPAWPQFNGKTLALRPQLSAATAQNVLPEQKIAWEYSQTSPYTVFTGNAGESARKVGFTKIYSTPKPLPQNLLTQSASNLLKNLVDGNFMQTGDNVMFPKDETVQLRFVFQNAIQPTEITWNQWHAKTSSKQLAFRLQKAIIEVSSDNFQKDIRKIQEYAEERDLPDWGAPIPYQFPLGKQECTALRLTLIPKPGTGIYLAELAIRGELTDKNDIQTCPINAIATGKIREGKQEGIVFGSSIGELAFATPDGKAYFHRQFSSPIKDIICVDLNQDGMDEIGIALHEGRVIFLDYKGNQLWDYKLDFYRVRPYANLLFSGDINGDGLPEIICGAENWRFYAFDAKGKFLWHYEAVHPSRSGAVADLDGDGKCEILCGTHYYSMSILNGDGKPRWKAHFGPICRSIATGRFHGNKTRGVVAGSGNGLVYYFDSIGKLLMQFNTGEEVRQVCTGDLDADGRDEFYAASLSQFVYCWDASAKLRWAKDLGSPVNTLTLIDNQLLAGLADGRIITLDKDGNPVRQRNFEGKITILRPCGRDVLVATERGAVYRITP